MNRNELLLNLKQYKTSHSEELPFINQFITLLADADCYQRTHQPGHLTGSAWIINQSRTHALLVHHAKLNKWMQPGGHADGDENILRVALKEAEEETGLQNFKVLLSAPFDVDIHAIPARANFPEHLHFDVRFLLEADMNEKIVVSEESHDVKWIPLSELEVFNPSRSILRMKEKLLRTNE